MKSAESGFNMDLELSFSIIEKLQTFCNELISKFEFNQNSHFIHSKRMRINYNVK